jgi:hypothetical protein
VTALLMLVLAQSGDVFANPEPFKVLEVKGGLTLQGRPIRGSKYSEYRVVTDTPYPVSALCEHIYEWGTKGTDHPGVKLHRVLKDGPDERVVYDQLEQPVVADRDYALTVVRRREPDGTCRIRFWTSNQLAPPPPKGFVRMERLWGSWQFEPLQGGKARLTYTLFADPGGSIPAFLVHGPQKSAAKDSVVTGLRKVKEALATRR